MADEDAATSAVAVASDTEEDEDILRRHELPVYAMFVDRTVAGVPVIAAAAAARGCADDEIGTIVGVKLEAKQETKFRR